jgi:glycine hydroxymethyltransferase
MDILQQFAAAGLSQLRDQDRPLYEILLREHCRQAETLSFVAASGGADPSVLACESLTIASVTAEGYPGARFHGGSAGADDVERLAIARARAAFGAAYANVQPHSGTSANQIVLSTLLQPGDCILGMDLDAGGHLTHGAQASFCGRYFRAVHYGVNESGLIDFDQVAQLAHGCRPRVIICGASAYPRQIDFQRFRAVADDVGAYLLADISHIAGLVAAGEHPSPIDHAHFTTTATYKQLAGPRGGVILMGKDHALIGPDGRRTLAATIDRGVFPFFQGTPNFATIAAKARAFAQLGTPEFKQRAARIKQTAAALAAELARAGYRVVSGGTDTHMVLLDLRPSGVTGVVAERALEECGIIVNRNRIPGDTMGPTVTSGLRFGTNTVALRGLQPGDMAFCVRLVDRVLRGIDVTGDREYRLDAATRASVRELVAAICARCPLPGIDAMDRVPADLTAQAHRC